MHQSTPVQKSVAWCKKCRIVYSSGTRFKICCTQKPNTTVCTECSWCRRCRQIERAYPGFLRFSGLFYSKTARLHRARFLGHLSKWQGPPLLTTLTTARGQRMSGCLGQLLVGVTGGQKGPTLGGIYHQTTGHKLCITVRKDTRVQA